MKTIATTKMSSKGQVVIPEKIRKQLGLKSGSQFVVLGKDDVVILKAITSQPIDEFDELILKARGQAKRLGLRQSDIEEAISQVRAH